MSRIGNRVLTIPQGVEMNIDGNKITVKGPKGQLDFEYRTDAVDVKIEDGKVLVTRKNEAKTSKQLHGTTNAMINNMLIGVSNGFTRELEINGVGYRFQLQGNKIIVSAGYSHNVEVIIPEGITVTMPDKSTNKGKGIKFKEEHIRRKEGKKAA